jgi:hypothetical protein
MQAGERENYQEGFCRGKNAKNPSVRMGFLLI